MNPGEIAPSISLLVGLPASGKTTYVNSYIKSHPETVVISSDDIIQKYADDNGMTYDAAWPIYKDEAEKLFREYLRLAIESKKSILVDRTNLSVKSRRRVMANVPKTYNKYALIFSVSEDELRRRLLQRKFDAGKSIPDDVIGTMRDRYEAPSEEEGFDAVIKIA